MRNNGRSFCPPSLGLSPVAGFLEILISDGNTAASVKLTSVLLTRAVCRTRESIIAPLEISLSMLIEERRRETKNAG